MSDSTTNELTRSFVTLELERNRRPPQMGLPGSGGSLEDHIQIEDGLGATRYLPLDVCLRPDVRPGRLPNYLVLTLPIEFAHIS